MSIDEEEFRLIHDDDLIYALFGTFEEFKAEVDVDDLQFAYWACVQNGQMFAGSRLRKFSTRPDWATHVFWCDG